MRIGGLTQPNPTQGGEYVRNIINKMFHEDRTRSKNKLMRRKSKKTSLPNLSQSSLVSSSVLESGVHAVECVYVVYAMAINSKYYT
jgi:hypothetical protein